MYKVVLGINVYMLCFDIDGLIYLPFRTLNTTHRRLLGRSIPLIPLCKSLVLASKASQLDLHGERYFSHKPEPPLHPNSVILLPPNLIQQQLTTSTNKPLSLPNAALKASIVFLGPLNLLHSLPVIVIVNIALIPQRIRPRPLNPQSLTPSV